MKAIVAIKTSSSRPTELLRHCYRPHGRYKDEVECEDRVISVGGKIDGGITKDPKTDLQSLLLRHHGQGKRVRHVVISFEDSHGLDRAKALSNLPKIVEDFVKKYAPHSDYIFVTHQDRQHPHVHLLVCNSDKKKLWIGLPRH